MDTDVETFVAVMTKRQTLKSAQRTSRLTLTGNGDAFGRLLNALPRPELAPIPSS